MLILAGVLGALAAGAALEVFGNSSDATDDDALGQEGGEDLNEQTPPDPVIVWL